MSYEGFGGMYEGLEDENGGSFPSIPDFLSYLNQAPPFTIEYPKFPNNICAFTENGKIRLQDSTLILCLVFSTVDVHDVGHIEIKVKKTDQNESEAALLSIQRNNNWRTIQSNKIWIDVDLESVYKCVFDKQVYEIGKKFMLIVVLKNARGQLVASKDTRPFNIIPNNKRKGDFCHDMATPLKHGRGYTNPAMLGSTNSSINTSGNAGGQQSPNRDGRGGDSPYKDYKAVSVIADEIRTKSLQVDGSFMGKTLTTVNGDIAYHFGLKDEDQIFEEGEIVGFVGGGDNQRVEKLTLATSANSKLRGVVTRSQYFEAQKPPENANYKTETICMLGSVPVQVIGSTHANEFLYSAPNHPGLAISGHNLTTLDDKNYAFIGVAISSHKTDDESLTGVVQAFVSLVETASQTVVSDKLAELKTCYNHKIDDIKGKSKCWRKGCVSAFVSFMVLVLLLGIFFWQYYYPGTALRYYICKVGSFPNGITANFEFVPFGNTDKAYQVNGVEFSFEKLISKMGYKDYKPLSENGTKFRYFLNLDRCAYGGTREIADKSLGWKRVTGPTIFAVGPLCNFVYYYDEEPSVGGWVRYNSARWDWYRRVHCSPQPRESRVFRKKYSQCEEGRRVGAAHINMHISSEENVAVKGNEFALDGLAKKMNKTYLPLNERGSSYFYNVDRCVYEKLRREGLQTFHLNPNGPFTFAVDGVCSKMYNYRNSQWVENQLVNWEIYRNINCTRNKASTSYKFRYMSYDKNRLVPHSSATFSYESDNDGQWREASGIEFPFEALSKFPYRYMRFNPLRINGSGFQYFLNINWFSYMKIKIKKIYGAKLFAIDPQCNRVYYYSSRRRWVMYDSARWDLYRNVFCSRETNASREFKQAFAQCEQGAIDVTSYATFSYTSSRKPKKRYVRGAEFRLEDLNRKLNGSYKALAEGGRYYFNGLRCVASHLPNMKPTSYGPTIFAISGNCSKAHYYSRHGRWKPYRSSKNLECFANKSFVSTSTR